MNVKNNITSINRKITVLSDIIQKSRTVLSYQNSNTSFSTDETRKLILLCILFLRTKKVSLNSDSISLENILTHLNIDHNGCLETCINDTIQNIELSGTLMELSHMFQYPDWVDLINYALEALEYDVDEYFSINASRGTRGFHKKKKQGIYYTPNDVIDFIISQCISPLLSKVSKPSILDCSCGSGVFLISVLQYLDKVRNPNHGLDISLEMLNHCIWGIDISQAAVDCCKLVILQYYIDNYEEALLRLTDIWSIINKSIFAGDATHLQEILTQSQCLPECFDCIIGNPPYVTKSKNTNLFIPFVENMVLYSSECSYSALILPLSICYSQGSEFIRLRNMIQNDNATWTFMNYDRSPDSLFGDQVKTRNTILFRNNTENTKKIFTTNLQRWSSINRNVLFKTYMLCDISEISISKYIPKISNFIEKEAYNCICSGSSNIKSLLNSKTNSYPLIINGTAYNWLYAYDHQPPSVDEHNNPYISTSTKTYHLPDRDSRDFCISILSNRIAYWYWTVIGDGFHLNTSFLSEFRIGKSTFTESQYYELCNLGKKYSEKLKKKPTVSYNSGKKIINYSYLESMDTVKDIEKIIINALNLSDDFASYIEQWYFNQVNCNRNNEKR